ncbi:patatin-like phospholipase family protein [Candidatus Nitrosocosmicus franklandus]|uniref:Patatin-like phospholipase n=1 Tax=Candidatus Nitrosocosmicus franklandianus TaxID=1798806 RepID=A0A484I7F3_9ARCH|nr:patatin-like phospholipase family protein [Candidatus Nitrosocosmicus franklandus]VFJ13668.1 Patatin-like phospholipase [Candidatus Nitrosocosmicus franklandus]
MAVSSEIPDKQRVLILQGGGALGAYQVGAFKALAEELPKMDANRGETNRPLFDIVAGTSIGAINAAILVSHFKQNNGWKGAFEKLEEFWNYISFDTSHAVDSDISWWESDHKNDENAASVEAARRYYSAKFFLKNGTPHVFSYPEFKEDDRFFDYSISLPNNQWFLYSNEELKRTICDSGFAKFPISTTIGEPRLLIVSTDVGDGATVTFDSYLPESKYGRVDERSGKYLEHTIKHNQGIEVSHVMASACIPLFYNYEEIDGRKFWDGGVLSNTPLREVIHMHRYYWYDKIGKREPGSKVPNLEIYIIGVWPSSEDGDSVNKDNAIPSDYDGLKAKFYDINLSDKTEYDEKSATMVSDLIEIIGNIRSLAPKHMNLDQQKEFDMILQDFLKRDAQSKSRDGEKRSYGSLLNGRVKLDKVVRIELRESKNDISNKAFDLSAITTKNLMEQGEKDTKYILKD